MTEQRVSTLRERALQHPKPPIDYIAEAEVTMKRVKARHELALKLELTNHINGYLETIFGPLDHSFQVKRNLSDGRWDSGNRFGCSNLSNGVLVTDGSVWLVVAITGDRFIARFAGYDRDESREDGRFFFTVTREVYDLDSLGDAIRTYEYEQVPTPQEQDHV